MIDTFTYHFSQITDPRQSAKITYPLFDVMFLTLCSIIAGCEGWEDIEDFAEEQLDWFQSKGLLLSGVPVHDTIARIIARLDPDDFHRCFSNWMKDVAQLLDDEIIAIDGKTLRSSYNREDRKSVIHMVSAFATSNGVVIGQVKTANKSNEITAIPELLELLDIKGCLVSIDAMGCQKEIAEKIVDQGGDYFLAVKGNQETLNKAVKEQLSDAVSASNTPNDLPVEQNRSRLEIREYHVMEAEELAKEHPEWKALKSIGVAVGMRLDKSGKVSLEYRYYISSASLTQERFAQAVRRHWGIENELHWVLDVTMKEDNCQIYKDNSAENLAVMRHAALNMLRNEKSEKKSVRRKQRKAYVNTKYLELVLSTEFNQVKK